MEPSDSSTSREDRQDGVSASHLPWSFAVVLLLAFFSLGVGGYWLLSGSFVADPSGQAYSAHDFVSRDPGHFPVSPSRGSAATRALPNDVATEPPGAIANERVLVFADADALNEAIDRLRQAGVRILGRIAPLNALRIQASGEFRSMFPEWREAEEFNIGVRMPTPPAVYEDLRSGYRSFEGQWLDSLGLSLAGMAGERGNGVMIAVLDTGFYPHADMDLSRMQWLDLVEGAAQWKDPIGHGTAVAGLIGSRSVLAPGLSLDADLMMVRVLDENGMGNTFNVAAGIVAAVDAGVHIINLSLGSSGHSPLLLTAVEYAASHGVVIVAAAGNDGTPKVSFPAAYPDVIGVTAVDADRYRAGFANYGEGVDIAAPGVGIYSLSNDDGYIYFDGTSASAPIVSASLAWMMGRDPEISAMQAVEMLKAHADDTGPPGKDVLMGHGIVNLGRVERREGPDYFDLALADIFPDVRYADSGSLPVLVSVENRGNTSAAGARLEVNLSGSEYTFYFGRMEPNAVMNAEIPSSLQLTRSEAGMQIFARVVPVDRESDDNPDNDAFGIMFRAAPEK